MLIFYCLLVFIDFQISILSVGVFLGFILENTIQCISFRTILYSNIYNFETIIYSNVCNFRIIIYSNICK